MISSTISSPATNRYRSQPALSSRFDQRHRPLSAGLGHKLRGEPRRVINRLVAVLKQLRQSGPAPIVVGDLHIDRVRFQVQTPQQTYRLTPTEFRLLSKLADQPGRVFTRQELLIASRGDDVNSLDRTIDVHVRKLRTKLGPYGDLIVTIRGVGYSLREGLET